MTRGLVALGLVALLGFAGTAWMLASERRGPPLHGTFAPRERPDWPLSSTRAAELRDDALSRARVRIATAGAPALDLTVQEREVTCRFLARRPTGTSNKFHCVLDGGEVVKVKYGRNPEVVAEVAATRLLGALGFVTDRMTLAERVRCYGCPRAPFIAMRLLHHTGTSRWYSPPGDAGAYTEFTWASIERKIEAAPIDLPDRKGWAWWELDRVDPRRGASRAELDALRLVAIFLAHWDNKDENQRLLCLDAPGAINSPCARPVLMLDDLGATFGPAKANMARWASLPIWSDPATCAVSMKALPHGGATFPDTRISEAGRAQLARYLSAITDDQVRVLFAAARFPEHLGDSREKEPLAAWQQAFRHRVEQITGTGPCPQ